MRLSQITVEELRAGHDAFVAKMKQVRLENPIEMEHRGVPLVETTHDPDWREKLKNKSPFDDVEEPAVCAWDDFNKAKAEDLKKQGKKIAIHDAFMLFGECVKIYCCSAFGSRWDRISRQVSGDKSFYLLRAPDYTEGEGFITDNPATPVYIDSRVYEAFISFRDEFMSLLSERNKKSLPIEWEYEDNLPEVNDKVFSVMYAASEIIDGVRMYPFVCDHGKRQYLVDIGEK